MDRHTEKFLVSSRGVLIFQSECSFLTIIHERVFQFRAGETDGPEVVQHHPRGAGVDDVSQAEVGDPVEEGEDVRPRLLHGEQHDAVVLLGVVGQDGDDEVGVERVEVGGGLVEEEDDGIADELDADGDAAVLTLGQGLDVAVGDVGEGQVSHDLLHPRRLDVRRDLQSLLYCSEDPLLESSENYKHEACNQDLKIYIQPVTHYIQTMTHQFIRYLRAYGHVCRVAESLFDGEAGDEVALLSDVPAALLEEAHRHGNPVEEDLSSSGTLGAPRNYFQ